MSGQSADAPEEGDARSAEDGRGDRRRSRSADISALLLDAAVSILASDGPDALTVRAVSSRAGVAPAGVYSRFAGKEGLLDAVLNDSFGLLHETLLAASGPDSLSRLEAACEAYRSYALEHPQRYHLMFDPRRTSAMSSEVMASAARAFGELVTRVADAMEAGTFRAGTPVEVAQQVWSGIHGAVSIELGGLGFTPDPAGTYRALVAMLLRGLQPAGSRSPGAQHTSLGRLPNGLT